MLCRDIMRRPVLFANVGETASTAARQMDEANIGFLPVCTSDGHVVGVVTDRDIALRVCAAERDPTRTKVEDVMSTELVACRADDELDRVEELMATQQKSRILILEDGRAVGVISISDLAAHLEPHTTETLRRVARREVLSEGGRRAHRH